jgi:hypothetical protein
VWQHMNSNFGIEVNTLIAQLRGNSYVLRRVEISHNCREGISHNCREGRRKQAR